MDAELAVRLGDELDSPGRQRPRPGQDIERHAEAAGRGDRAFDIGIMPPWMYIGDPPFELAPHEIGGSPEAIAAELRSERELGANVFHLKFRNRSLDELLDQIARFGADVAPLVKEA